jgi:hypothetical protein
MIQDVMIYVVGVTVIIWLCYKLYRFVFTGKGRTDKCAGCAGCDLKDISDKVSPGGDNGK